MGALKSAFWAEDEGDKIFYERYLELVEADEHEYQDIDIIHYSGIGWFHRIQFYTV